MPAGAAATFFLGACGGHREPVKPRTPPARSPPAPPASRKYHLGRCTPKKLLTPLKARTRSCSPHAASAQRGPARMGRIGTHHCPPCPPKPQRSDTGRAACFSGPQLLEPVNLMAYGRVPFLGGDIVLAPGVLTLSLRMSSSAPKVGVPIARVLQRTIGRKGCPWPCFCMSHPRQYAADLQWGDRQRA